MVAAQTQGDCNVDQCNGSGAIETVPSATDVEDDGNPCTQDSCNAGVRVHDPVPVNTSCGDPLKCNAVGQCVGCIDSGDCPVPTNSCLVATCNAGVCGTANKSDGTACNDGNACTQSDTCQAGACTGAFQWFVLRLDQCHTAGSCDSSTGQCSNPNAPDGQSCNDGNACTQTDSCQSGTCLGANPVICGSFDQCHVAGTCNTTTGVCSNPNAPNGAGCDDGNACTQTDTCQSGACTGAAPVICSALDQCHSVGTCNPGNGACTNPAKPNGQSCSDGNACTQTDTCQAGACTGANPVTCSPQDQCHNAGTCDTSTGNCSNPAKADGTACNDGNLCTQSDTCQAGACTGASPVVCTALDQCHDAGTCNAGTGTCSTPAKTDGAACNDGNACTQSESCQGGSCTGGSAVSIDDSNACTADACDPVTGVSHTPVTVTDGDACTTDSCDPSTGTISHTPVSIDDSDVCTNDSCDSSTGVISHTAVNKDDGISCTVDACDPVTGVSHTPNDALCGSLSVCSPTGCVAATAADQVGDVIISEFSALGTEYVELRNTKAVAVNIRGYQLASLDQRSALDSRR
ncbi:MAG: hypothetical protein U0165_15670 [Polyangiaceae bacterium]